MRPASTPSSRTILVSLRKLRDPHGRLPHRARIAEGPFRGQEQDLFRPGYTGAVRRSLSFALLAACSAAGLLAAALLVGTPSAGAQEGTTTGTTTAPPPPPTTTATTTTTTTTTTAPMPPRPTTIPAGVTIAGELLVGGLSTAQATIAVKAFFAQPVMLRLRAVSLRATPKRLGVRRRRGQAGPDRAARRERPPEGGSPAREHRALRPHARAPLRPRSVRGRAFTAERPAFRDKREGRAPTPADGGGPRHRPQPEDARADADRASHGQARAAGDPRDDRRRDRDSPRRQPAEPLRRDEAPPHVRRRHRRLALSDAPR